MLKKSIDYIFGMIRGASLILTFWACTQTPLGASGSTIQEIKIVNALLELLNKPEELVKYQKLSWNNFSHTAFLSASKLDDYRNKIMFKFIK